MEKAVLNNRIKKVGVKSSHAQSVPLKIRTLRSEIMTQIKNIQNEDTLQAVGAMLKALSTEHLIYQITKPMRETLTVEDLIKEQNYKGFDRQGFDKLIAELDVQDPIEELLALDTP